MRKNNLTRRPENDDQSRAFIEKAREIEADEDRSSADDLLGKLARMKPDPRSSKN